MTTPVSIITPAFNAQDCISRAARSVIAQTHKHWEMIIVADDGQDYEAILKGQGVANSRLRFTTTKKIGSGPGVARNIGLDHARHDIIANMDADDAFSTNYLSAMLPAAVQYGACTPAVRVIDVLTGDTIPIGFPLKADQALTMHGLMRHCPTFAPIMFNRRWCEAKWPELHYGEDLLFWLLLLDDLPTICFVADARYDYYFRKGSLSRPDEKTTHGLCERRNGMIQWLEQTKSRAGNADNRDILKRWLATCNEMEYLWGYQLVELDVYFREIDRRFNEVFRRFQAVYDIACA